MINPPKEEIYQMLDHKIMVEDREIPVRVFIPSKNPIPKLLIFFMVVVGLWETLIHIQICVLWQMKHVIRYICRLSIST